MPRSPRGLTNGAASEPPKRTSRGDHRSCARDPELVRQRQSGHAHQSGPHAQRRYAGRHRQDGDPPGGPGLRARTGAQLRPESGRLRPALSLPARDRIGLQRLRGAREFAGQIPLILKLNNHDVLYEEKDPEQAITGSVRDALRLGCVGIGYTIYPGSSARIEMYSKLRELGEEAKANGLVLVVWSYPRGSGLSKEGETGIDVTAYAAHIAAQLGAHIVKVKLPAAHLEQRATN